MIRSVLVLAVAALALAGCGNRHEVITQGDTEGLYLDVGPLEYQVQISRELNPNIVPDSGYLAGLPEFIGSPKDDETWFAVFMRVQNQTEEPHEAAEDFEIVDTQEKVYRPVALDAEVNPLAYAPVELPPGSVYPSADSVAGDSPTQGRLLLFKVSHESLQNRPLILKITSPEGEEGEVDLDV